MFVPSLSRGMDSLFSDIASEVSVWSLRGPRVLLGTSLGITIGLDFSRPLGFPDIANTGKLADRQCSPD